MLVYLVMISTLLKLLVVCTRVPSLKTKLAEIFGKPLSFTLNQDEAIVRGNAFICATHSPTLRVRTIQIRRLHPYSGFLLLGQGR